MDREHKPTTNRLMNSRVIKVGLIGILCLMVIQGISWGIVWWIVRQMAAGGFDLSPESGYAPILLQLVEILGGVSVVAAIGTIVTALIARYGLRESTGNLAQQRGEQ